MEDNHVVSVPLPVSPKCPGILRAREANVHTNHRRKKSKHHKFLHRWRTKTLRRIFWKMYRARVRQGDEIDAKKFMGRLWVFHDCW
jgi:hypothetical protein